MTATMQRALSVLIFTIAVSVAHAQTPTLTCEGKEETALRQAHGAARRVSEHRLTIQWAAGTAAFVDSGTVAGYMDGIDYWYCGFNAVMGFHLIHKHDEAIFTGVLLNHSTGKLLPAGQEVIFAADGSRYFATVQPDGLDGQEWYVYTRDGALVWKGLSGITEKGPRYDYFVAELEKPHWTAGGELQAILTCAIAPDRRSAVVTLTQVKDGWAWLPSVACRKADAPKQRRSAARGAR